MASGPRTVTPESLAESLLRSVGLTPRAEAEHEAFEERLFELETDFDLRERVLRAQAAAERKKARPSSPRPPKPSSPKPSRPSSPRRKR